MLLQLLSSFVLAVLLWWLFCPVSFGKHMAKVDAGRSALTKKKQDG